MERHASWFPLVATLLIVVGVLTLAAPPPAHAMDPQLALALASAAGAIALVVGYLLVANGREKERSAALEGIYTCGTQEDSGPMGCGGPSRPVPMAAAPAPESPMTADIRSGSRGESFPSSASPMAVDSSSASRGESAQGAGPMPADNRAAARTGWLPGSAGACPAGQAAGPMGCDGAAGSAPTYSAPAPAPSAPASAPPVASQGQ